MAKNEAKIKFTAETGEFNDSIKKANGSMTELRAELKLNETQMKSTGASVELLEKKHGILKEQLAVSESKTEALNQKLKKAIEIFGENSDEASKLRVQLLNAQTAEEKLRIEVNKCETELDQQKNAVEESEQATEELTKENKDLDKSFEEVEDSAGKVGEVLGNLGGAVCAATVAGITAITAAAVAAGKALIDMSVDGAAYADEVLTMSTQTGIATDKLQEYQYAAELIDVSTETLTGSMAKQIKSMKSVQDGAKTMTSAYDKLGVKVTNADGTLRNSDDVYWEVIDALGKMENETERDALAMQILGKSAQELNPLIEAGAGKMAELGQQAHEAGYVLSDETLEAYGAFDDQLQYLSVGATAAKNALGTVLLPTLTQLATEGNDLLGRFTQGVNECGGDISGIGDVISELMPEVVSMISGYVPQILDLAVSVVGSLASALLDNLPSLISALTDVIWSVLDMLPSLVDGVTQTFTTLVDQLPIILDRVLEAVTFAVPDLVNCLVGVITTIVAEIPNILEVLVTYVPWIIEELIGALLNNVPALISGIQTLVVDLIGYLPQIIETLIDLVVNVATMLVEQLPVIIPMLVEATVSIITALVQELPTIVMLIVDALPTIIHLICDTLIENTPLLMEAVVTIVEALVQAMPEIVMALVDALPTILQTVWDCIVTVFQTLPEWFGQLFDGVVNVIAAVFPNAKDKVMAVGSSIKESIGKTFTAIKTNAKTVWEGIKNTMVKPIQTARDTIKGIIDKIKGFFSGAKLEFPKIKLPHFSIKPSGWKIGDLLEGSIPKLGIDWYAKAVSNPMVMDRPTIFGYSNGRLLGGGEAGSEMIGGTNTVMGMIQNAVDKSMQAMNLSTLAAAIEDLANRPIELDINGRQFALATAGDSDRVNGMRNRIIERGVLLD